MLIFLFFRSLSFAQTFNNSDCLECHGEKDLTKIIDDTLEVSLFIDAEKFSNAAHGGFECIDCHLDIDDIPHEETLQKPDCNMCHDDVAEVYATSIHGLVLTREHKDAPYCWDCHTSHYVYPVDDSLSSIFILNQPKVCARCHSDPELIKKYRIPVSHPSELYEHSIHYNAAVQDGHLNAAKCSDCHGAHDTQPSRHSQSKTNRFQIAQTCSQCHEKEFHDFIESVHGVAMIAGSYDAPVCTDCHSEHNIKAHIDPASTVYSTVISQTLCRQCHEAARIVSKYNIREDVIKSYNDSYHGLASRGGSTVTANCASCHGVHDIRHSSDPKSAIHKDNLKDTCGSCHPGVTDQVAKGSVHVVISAQENKIIYYVRMFYIVLIVAVIGGMVFHNGLDFLKKLKKKFKYHHPAKTEMLKQREFIRLTLNERIQHFLLMGSFITLVYTGFAMKFPEAWWAAPLIRWEGGFAFRGLLHRIAAVVMIGLAIYHVVYMITSKRGREQFFALLPTLKDVKDVIQMFKFFFGIEKERPKFDRFNYIEKAEYWALIWGTVVMSITGFILWFANISLRYFPKWVMDVSLIIHYFEAVLATLAILVWHFYFQFFDPHVYPMNTTCITGKMSEADMKHEHPLEYERLTGKSE